MVDPRIEQLLNEVEKQSGLRPSAALASREAVETSPYLASATAQAIERGGGVTCLCQTGRTRAGTAMRARARATSVRMYSRGPTNRIEWIS